MMKEHAIEKAGETVKDRARNGLSTQVDVHPNSIALIGKYDGVLIASFDFTPPRRIPPKDTHVCSALTWFTGYSNGTTDDEGKLECFVYVNGEKIDHKLSDWIELQEVKNDME